MAEDTDQERTEDPTPRRLQQAREKGQVARSKELNTAAVLLASAFGMMIFGQSLAETLAKVMKRLFTLNRDESHDVNQMMSAWPDALMQLLFPMGGFIAMLFVATLAGSILMGGITFSSQAMAPKLSKMSPAKGFKRMFGVQALVELLKAVAKFAFIALFAFLLLSFKFEEILHISVESFPGNIAHAVELLLFMFIILCLSLLFIVAIDVPFQIWNHTKQLRMTKQEVRDEMKDVEGRPEVKGRVRQMQREIAQRRMMGDVPKADVVVTNPTHYSVALKYDVNGVSAPRVIAKGNDEVAMKIREIAREKEVPIMVAPPLARAIYYTTKLGKEIPDGLFVAVAQVLAYVYQLNEYKKGTGKKPTPLPKELPIPDELKH
ncbi:MULTISPECIES: flagellar biosynthesis protein FlhB [Corallincola]|uniref:Flagellar biosynthetic protein FlhB n=3 Tax=Corallincola TaxID=1775176 RepID=A0A368N5M3_9GAMM|nr:MULTISPECIES: flagellar biosynthesis protein FlhB [Corallincola]RCU44559.1 flagellar biosynthesis protein FlhB [Corallincola holothuriorum]TAA40304.1 flagellar biosynthesis protein FlhB [Corallincola spongiicola]TCI05389.1 flagellar biosynthesis protein FlhB [Corallincola luteus]